MTSEPLTPDRLAAIRRSAELVAYTERQEFGGEKLATYQLAAHVVPELLAEVERLTAELATQRAGIAYRIRAELVCCDVYQQDHDTDRAGTRHAICFWGEAAAQLQAVVEHLTAQLRQKEEERAAVALERDEAINDRNFAVLRTIRVEWVAEAAKTWVGRLHRGETRTRTTHGIGPATKTSR